MISTVRDYAVNQLIPPILNQKYSRFIVFGLFGTVCMVDIKIY